MSVGSRDSRVAGRLPRWEVQADRRDHVGWPLLMALGNRDSWQAVWSQLRGQLATPVLEVRSGMVPGCTFCPKQPWCQHQSHFQCLDQKHPFLHV